MLKLVLIALFATILPAPVAVESHAAAARSSHLSRVLIVSVDGLRPDVLVNADAPVFHELMKRGSYSLRARTTAMAVTLPSHTSMLTGVPPSEHGVTWNNELAIGEVRYPRRPTLFELARKSGFTTAMVTGKLKFKPLDKPGALDWSYVMRTDDATVANTAIRLIERHAPEVLFVHLPGVDRAGHSAGWGSPSQFRAVATADRSVGRILEALRSRGVLDSTVIVLSSDHGGSGRSHGPNNELSRRIPWVISGPGIRRNVDLDKESGIEVDTEDTFATVCGLLGIPRPAGIKGRLVNEILERVRPTEPAQPTEPTRAN